MPPSAYSPYDIIISLSNDLVDDLFMHEVDALIRIWPCITSISSDTKRIWVYEQLPTRAITCVIRLDYHYHPARFYQLTTPVTLETMEDEYDYHPNQIPGPAPKWLLHDYAKFRRHIW
jgi:hypothetical protein